MSRSVYAFKWSLIVLVMWKGKEREGLVFHAEMKPDETIPLPVT